MMLQSLPLVNWGNGVFMIAIFAIVCVLLIAAILILVMGGKSKKDTN